MASVAILMSVYNRKEKTLSCLSDCYRQIEALSSSGDWTFEIYLHDDNSTDGLQDEVRENFPKVNIIRTLDARFLNRGRLLAWERASKEKFDFYIWLDYDLDMNDNAFSVLLENSAFVRNKAIIVGSVAWPESGNSGRRRRGGGEPGLKYGGRTRRKKLIVPDKVIPVICDIFDGNLVLVPKFVYDSIGMLDDRFQQRLGDYDYAIRAKKAGVARLVAPGVLATCRRIEPLPIWRDGKYSLRERYAALQSPFGSPLKEQFLYDRHSMNLLYAAANFVAVNFSVLFPCRKKRLFNSLFFRKLFGKI